MFPVKNSEPNNWNTCENDVVKLVKHIVVDRRATKEADPAKHPNRNNVQYVFVEHVRN